MQARWANQAVFIDCCSLFLGLVCAGQAVDLIAAGAQASKAKVLKTDIYSNESKKIVGILVSPKMTGIDPDVNWISLAPWSVKDVSLH